jgi:hypothetical protein
MKKHNNKLFFAKITAAFTALLFCTTAFAHTGTSHTVKKATVSAVQAVSYASDAGVALVKDKDLFCTDVAVLKDESDGVCTTDITLAAAHKDATYISKTKNAGHQFIFIAKEKDGTDISITAATQSNEAAITDVGKENATSYNTQAAHKDATSTDVGITITASSYIPIATIAADTPANTTALILASDVPVTFNALE